MKSPQYTPTSSVRALVGATLALLVGAVAPKANAQEKVLSFDSDQFISSGSVAADVEFSKAPPSARSATRVLHEFGPSAPQFNYSGPSFSLGFEVRASAPTNLTVSPDKAVVEDNFKNGATKRNDTILIAASGDWPEETVYSVAAVVVFPTASFSLESLAYSSNNWAASKTYNANIRHRWVVQADGIYYVNITFLGRSGGGKEPGAPMDVIRTARTSPGFDRWVPYDPKASIFVKTDGTWVALGDALDRVTAVGFYMDSLDFNGAGAGKLQWQLRLITLEAMGH